MRNQSQFWHCYIKHAEFDYEGLKSHFYVHLVGSAGFLEYLTIGNLVLLNNNKLSVFIPYKNEKKHIILIAYYIRNFAMLKMFF